MKCNNCGCKVDKNDKFCQNCGDDVLNQKSRKSKKNALISFFMSLIPIIVIAYAAHVDSGCESSCIGGIYVLMYVWIAGVPIGVCSTVLGISSFMIKENILAIIDILLGTLQLLAIFSLLH